MEKVTDDVAIRLKERGFPQFYSLAKKTITYNTKIGIEDSCIVPSIGAALKWLREVHFIHIEPYLYNELYAALIKSIKERDEDLPYYHLLLDERDEKFFNTYEDCMCDAILYTLTDILNVRSSSDISPCG